MNLKVLMCLLGYYAFFIVFGISLGFLGILDFSVTNNIQSSGCSNFTQFGQGNSTPISGSSCEMPDTSASTFGFLNTLTSIITIIIKFIGFIFFGVGLPGDTPFFIQLCFSIWQSLLSLFSIGFVISSFWDG